MAKKQIDQYFEQINQQYIEAIETLKAFEDMFANKMVSEEKLNDIVQEFQLIKNNRNAWVYMMYLWGMPARDKKAKEYEKQYCSKIKPFEDMSPEAIMKRNQEAIDRLNSLRED